MLSSSTTISTVSTISVVKQKKMVGFTLLEVMVALTIFSLIATVTLRGLAISMDSFERVKLKTFASIIAQNALTEIRVLGKLPAITESKKDLEFANLEWKLITKVSGTEDPNLVRVDFEVYRRLKDDETSKEMDYLGFVGKE